MKWMIVNKIILFLFYLFFTYSHKQQSNEKLYNLVQFEVNDCISCFITTGRMCVSICATLCVAL